MKLSLFGFGLSSKTSSNSTTTTSSEVLNQVSGSKASNASSNLSLDLDVSTPTYSFNSPTIPSNSTAISNPVISVLNNPDINSSQNFDYSLTESQNRIDEFSKYEHECSRINEYLYLSGMKVAQNADILKANSITRIINCAGTVVKNIFADGNSSGYNVKYLTFNLYDSKNDDISWFICQAIKFITESINANERILIHCEKGISRSVSILIGYLIWDQKISWKTCLNNVQKIRSIASPNSGFLSNLIELDSLFHGSDSNLSLYFRLAFHNENDLTPLFKLCRNKNNRSILKLNKKYSFANSYSFLLIRFVIEGAHVTYIWRGKNTVSESKFVSSIAYLMKDILFFATRIVIEKEGEESEEFLNLVELASKEDSLKSNIQYSEEELKDIYNFNDHYETRHLNGETSTATAITVPTSISRSNSSSNNLSRSNSSNGISSSPSERKNSKDSSFLGNLFGKRIFSNSKIDTTEFTEITEDSPAPNLGNLSKSDSFSFRPILSRANSYREDSNNVVSSSPPSLVPASNSNDMSFPKIISKENSRRFSTLSEVSDATSNESLNTKTTGDSTSSLESVFSKSNLNSLNLSTNIGPESKEFLTPTNSPVKNNRNSSLNIALNLDDDISGIGLMEKNEKQTDDSPTPLLPSSNLLHILGTPPKQAKHDTLVPSSPPRDDGALSLRRQISQTRYNILSNSPSNSNLLSNSPSQTLLPNSSPSSSVNPNSTSNTPSSAIVHRSSSSRKINLVPSSSNSNLLSNSPSNSKLEPTPPPSVAKLEPTPPSYAKPSMSRPSSASISTRPSSATTSPVAPTNNSSLSPSSSKFNFVPSLSIPTSTPPSNIPSISLNLGGNKEELIRGTENTSSNSFLPRINLSSSPSFSSPLQGNGLSRTGSKDIHLPSAISNSSPLITKPTLFSYDPSQKKFISLGIYDDQDLNEEEFFLLCTPMYSFFWYSESYLDNYSNLLPKTINENTISSWCKLNTNYSSFTNTSKVQIEKFGEESDLFLDCFNDGL